jgi:DNA-binding response OmpR family regulator
MNNNQKTILLVEDEDEISSHMNATLTGRGYRVVRARDADEAMKFAAQDHLSLILTDLDLPTLASLMGQLGAHETLKDTLVAIIDINHPENLHPDLKVLNNFEQLDELLSPHG